MSHSCRPPPGDPLWAPANLHGKIKSTSFIAEIFLDSPLEPQGQELAGAGGCAIREKRALISEVSLNNFNLVASGDTTPCKVTPVIV